MKYSMCARTDAGRVREHNEDSVAFDDEVGLCALADGLGGMDAGEVASGLATQLMLSHMSAWLRARAARADAAAIADELRACASDINRRLLEEVTRMPHSRGMASTLVVGVFAGPCLVLGHAGDSRCYRWREGQLIRLTRDHSYVQEQLDAGRMTPAQAAASGRRNLVTRALGAAGELRLEVHEHAVEPEDIYLLCSDGLTDMLSDAQAARIVGQAQPLARRAQALVDAANARGGRDNISVLLVHAGTCRTMAVEDANG